MPALFITRHFRNLGLQNVAYKPSKPFVLSLSKHERLLTALPKQLPISPTQSPHRLCARVQRLPAARSHRATPSHPEATSSATVTRAVQHLDRNVTDARVGHELGKTLRQHGVPPLDEPDITAIEWGCHGSRGRGVLE
jgi:hypothetical protein